MEGEGTGNQIPWLLLPSGATWALTVAGGHTWRTVRVRPQKHTHINTDAHTHRARYRHKNPSTHTHTHARPLTSSFCGAVSPTPDRAEKELVNIVLGENGANGREIMAERKQGEWREKTFKWYCYHQGQLLSKQMLVKIYMVYISKKRYKYLLPSLCPGEQWLLSK